MIYFSQNQTIEQNFNLIEVIQRTECGRPTGLDI